VQTAKQKVGTRTKKPKLFVGSAGETLGLAHAVLGNLDYVARVEVWDQATEPTKFLLGQLLDHVNGSDFGAFVFSPTDILVLRGKKWAAVRDNVLFELGLFIGRLGIERNFIIVPRAHQDLRLPTDLLGLVTLTYDPDGIEENPRTALGAACGDIERVIQKLGPLDRKPRELELLEDIHSWLRPAPFESMPSVAGLDKKVIKPLEQRPGRSSKRGREKRQSRSTKGARLPKR